MRPSVGHAPLAPTVASTIIVGAGSIGISTAYYLAKHYVAAAAARESGGPPRTITLIDRLQPMSLTSAQSGENYRNWWPHPAMVALTNHSIDLMEDIARQTNNRIRMNRRGYALATRNTDIDGLLRQLQEGLGGVTTASNSKEEIRFHTECTSKSYHSFASSAWEGVPSGVDVLQNKKLIQTAFPKFDPEISSIIHIRRGGDISGQQLGMYMLEYLKNTGVFRRLTADVKNVEKNGDQFTLTLADEQGKQQVVQADKFVNAAGPYAAQIGRMMGVELPIRNIAQQKIAFEDRAGAIPRTQPFSIDLDGQMIDWTEEEQEMLLQDPAYSWLAQPMPGSIHCRPDGGDGGKWVKLGWAYNSTPSEIESSKQFPLDDNFPDIVLRGASRLNPALKTYYGSLPRNMHHYGGWYTTTEENWPLIGPMGPVTGAFMNCGMSGFGTMAACTAGSLCADWVVGDGDVSTSTSPMADYAHYFSLARYKDKDLMAHLEASDKGVL